MYWWTLVVYCPPNKLKLRNINHYPNSIHGIFNTQNKHTCSGIEHEVRYVTGACSHREVRGGDAIEAGWECLLLLNKEPRAHWIIVDKCARIARIYVLQADSEFKVTSLLDGGFYLAKRVIRVFGLAHKAETSLFLVMNLVQRDLTIRNEIKAKVIAHCTY